MPLRSHRLILFVALFLSTLLSLSACREPQTWDSVPEFTDLCSDQQDWQTYQSRVNTANIGLFDVWETHVSREVSKVDPFDYQQIRLTGRFQSESNKTLITHGFYDGQDTWKIRFNPPAAGLWHYTLTWSDGDSQTTGQFNVSDKINTPTPPIAIDPHYPNKMVQLPNTPFHWVGGRWISAQSYAPCEVAQHDFLIPSQQWLSDQAHQQHFDFLQSEKHNAVLIKMAQYALLSDGSTWDLPWIQRAEWLVREAMARGIYVQINLFDTWSRNNQHKLIKTTNGPDHPFNVWGSEEQLPSNEDRAKAKNYLRTLVARFAAYPNIMWELGNEMEHSPNCGECFVKLANQYYIPWIKSEDPYDRLIGLSENVWQSTSVDVGFLHQTNAHIFEDLPTDRPLLMNELVRSDDSPALWRDEVIRDKNHRLAFRRTFWRMLMVGGVGSFEATWLNISDKLSKPVRNVMADHKHVASFIEDLTTQGANLNARQVNNTWVSSDDQTGIYGFTVEPGIYAAYILLSEDASRTLTVNLPNPDSRLRWYHSKTGEWEDATLKNQTLTLPKRAKDIVLVADQEN